MHFLDEILLVICVLCFQAGDRRDNINPKFKLYIMGTGNTGLTRKEILPPDEFQGRYANRKHDTNLKNENIELK